MPTIRPLRPGEDALLREATLGNVNWSGERFTMHDVRTRPDFAHYTSIESARGDFGLVAEQDERPTGVVWGLLLPEHDPGYGFIDARTPELSLGVRPDARGRGIGRDLLTAFLDAARARGVTQVSLSVEAGNHSRRLYAAHGFVPVPGREVDGVMVWTAD